MNRKIKEKDSNLTIGQGIFGLSESEKASYNFNDGELQLIKPYFTTEQIKKYFADENNKYWIIYTDSSFKNLEKMKPYPNLKKHLDKFQSIITSDNKPYGLHRARNEQFFKGEKVITLRKCFGEPQFTYTDFDCYVSATFYVIKTARINQKYLTAYLNSKVVAFWLRKKGKMQGSNYQLDKDPLIKIPIILSKNEKEIVMLFDKIKGIMSNIAKLREIVSKIDQLIYSTFGLSKKEIKMIESQLEK